MKLKGRGLSPNNPARCEQPCSRLLQQQFFFELAFCDHKPIHIGLQLWIVIHSGGIVQFGLAGAGLAGADFAAPRFDIFWCRFRNKMVLIT